MPLNYGWRLWHNCLVNSWRTLSPPISNDKYKNESTLGEFFILGWALIIGSSYTLCIQPNLHSQSNHHLSFCQSLTHSNEIPISSNDIFTKLTRLPCCCSRLTNDIQKTPNTNLQPTLLFKAWKGWIHTIQTPNSLITQANNKFHFQLKTPNLNPRFN